MVYSIILLRNLNLTKGLYNDTRLIVRDLKQYIIKAEIIIGTHLGIFLIMPSDVDLPF